MEDTESQMTKLNSNTSVMKRRILEIETISIKSWNNYYILKVRGLTRSGIYTKPELIFAPMIPEKEMISELFLEFYADDENAIFQSISSIDIELKILKKEYPNLKKITVKAEDNAKSIRI